MKNILASLASLLACAALGCGGAAQIASDQQPESLPGRAALRLLGVNTAGYGSVVLATDDVRCTLDGVPLAVTRATTPLELTQPNQAWLLGTFDLPASGMVHCIVRLAAKGSFAAGAAKGDVDARCLPLELEGPASSFAREHHGVFVLDVGHSLLDACPGTKMLVPQLKIAF